MKGGILRNVGKSVMTMMKNAIVQRSTNHESTQEDMTERREIEQAEITVMRMKVQTRLSGDLNSMVIITVDALAEVGLPNSIDLEDEDQQKDTEGDRGHANGRLGLDNPTNTANSTVEGGEHHLLPI